MTKREVITPMSRIRYIIRDAVRLIWRHLGMCMLTIFTATAVFFVIGATMLFIMNIRNAVDIMEDHLSIQTYLKPNADISAVEKKIKEMSIVKSTTIITKETALERLRARLGNQASAVTLLGSNPLPASIEVRVDKASDISEAARSLLTLPEVDDLVYAGTVAEKLTNISAFIEKFSLVMLIVALAASIVVLFNTIRISVYSREEEINVMMKVGATSTYVAFPFVLQGLFLGFTGALIASGLLGYFYFRAVGSMKDMLPFLDFIESPHLLLKMSLVLICCGTVVSLLASLIAVEKFIRKASRPL